eukprot:535884_1
MVDQKKNICQKLTSKTEIIEYPSKELLNDYFKFNGNILEITFNNKDKTYIIIFENENAIESLMIQNRLDIISHHTNNKVIIKKNDYIHLVSMMLFINHLVVLGSCLKTTPTTK